MIMIGRRALFPGLLAFCLPSPVMSHAPWGQYRTYRQKHLLILSTRDDAPSYPYSRKLADALAVTLPSARARPARAIHLDRAHTLLRTGQFQFALLSKSSLDMMRRGAGLFAGKPRLDLGVIYAFGGLEFAVRADFPDNLAAMVTQGVIEALPMLPGAVPPTEIRVHPMLHPGAARALSEPAIPSDQSIDNR